MNIAFQLRPMCVATIVSRHIFIITMASTVAKPIIFLRIDSKTVNFVKEETNLGKHTAQTRDDGVKTQIKNL